MSTVQRKWDLLTDADKKRCADDLIAYFTAERDETIGLIAATDIIDRVLQSGGQTIYKKAIDDAKTLLEQKSQDINVELDLLIEN